MDLLLLFMMVCIFFNQPGCVCLVIVSLAQIWLIRACKKEKVSIKKSNDVIFIPALIFE